MSLFTIYHMCVIFLASYTKPMETDKPAETQEPFTR